MTVSLPSRSTVTSRDAALENPSTGSAYRAVPLADTAKCGMLPELVWTAGITGTGSPVTCSRGRSNGTAMTVPSAVP